MSTLKDALSNIDNQNRYQRATLKNLACEKEYLERNVLCLILIQKSLSVLRKDMVT